MTALEKAQTLSEEIAGKAKVAAEVYGQLGDLLAQLGEALTELDEELNKAPTTGTGRKGRGWTEEGARRRILEVIRDYRGMPLNVHDVREEVGHISHSRARQLLAALVEEGVIASRKVEQGVDVYYDTAAEGQEAA